ncbi:MAG: maleylpyruvate isomerase family mycothiol-dependent enzyme [Acidimicrobiia bacterium]
MPTDIDYIGAIRENASALVDAAEQAGLDAPVPSCPKWNVADLLDHIGVVHRWAALSCNREPSDSFTSSRDSGIKSPDDVAARPAWVREGATELADTLASRSPEDACWTWAPPATIGFWQRRQAHETAMHRVDAQLAAGTAQPIDAHLAADGIDEWVTLLPNMAWREERSGAGETIHLHCTDVEGEWMLRLGASGLDVERTHGKGDVAARAPASSLLAWVMGRGAIDPLEVFGDRALLERWREDTKF